MSEKPVENRTEQRGYEQHEFEPHDASWFMPRCKVCREFGDHPIHQTAAEVIS